MKIVKSIVVGSLFTMIVVLTITLAAFVVNEVQPVEAKVVNPPVPVIEEVQYIPLTDALPQRDITTQQFTP